MHACMHAYMYKYTLYTQSYIHTYIHTCINTPYKHNHAYMYKYTLYTQSRTTYATTHVHGDAAPIALGDELAGSEHLIVAAGNRARVNDTESSSTVFVILEGAGARGVDHV